MGKVRKDINELILIYGGKDRARRASEEWYQKGKRDMKEKGIHSTGQRFQAGKIYVFRYSPKYAMELPWYDANPVVLALDPDKNNDVGVNLNLLPIKVKEDMLDSIYRTFESEIGRQSVGGMKNDATRQNRLSINWQDAKGFLKARGYDFAVRQYIPSRKSGQAVVSYENWARIVLCDFASLNGTTYGKLRYMFRNR